MKDDKTKQAHDLTPPASGDVTDSGRPLPGVDSKRRTLLKKTGGVAAGAVLLSPLMPKKWQKPAIDVVGLPVHAQTSPAATTTATPKARVESYSIELQEGVVIYSVILTGATGPIGDTGPIESQDLVAVGTIDAGTSDEVIREPVRIRSTTANLEQGSGTDILPLDLMSGTYTSKLSSPNLNVEVPENLVSMPPSLEV